jgi:hypothetical protein
MLTTTELKLVLRINHSPFTIQPLFPRSDADGLTLHPGSKVEYMPNPLITSIVNMERREERGES